MASSARIPVSSTPKKSNTGSSLRKVQDEDDLDELTMKKLEKEDYEAKSSKRKSPGFSNLN
jgi:hypothetical protein